MLPVRNSHGGLFPPYVEWVDLSEEERERIRLRYWTKRKGGEEAGRR